MYQIGSNPTAHFTASHPQDEQTHYSFLSVEDISLQMEAILQKSWMFRRALHENYILVCKRQSSSEIAACYKISHNMKTMINNRGFSQEEQSKRFQKTSETPIQIAYSRVPNPVRLNFDGFDLPHASKCDQ